MQFSFLKKKAIDLLNFVLPNRCAVCKAEYDVICPSCLNNFILCKRVPLQDIEAFCCFEYSGGIDVILRELKYHSKTENAKIVTDFLIKFHKPELLQGDILIPIPAHFFNRIKRRYNVPNLICLFLSKKLKIKIINALKKTNYKSQVGLNREKRIQNAEKSFALNTYFKNNFTRLKNKIENKNIILIDDTITTGSTIKAAINTIQKLNPKSIKVFAFAFRKLN